MDHLVPADDEIDHVVDQWAVCECGPVVIQTLDGANVTLHKAMDMRHLVMQADAIRQHTSVMLAKVVPDGTPSQVYFFDTAQPIILPPAAQRIQTNENI